MKFKKILIAVIVLILVFVILILALSEFEFIRTYIPLDVSIHNMTLGVAQDIRVNITQGVPVDFGINLYPASYENAAPTPISIDNIGNTELKIEIMGAEYFTHKQNPSTYYFYVGNVSWNNTNNPTPTPLNSTNYTEVQPSLNLANTKNIYLFVDIPPSQYSGLYNSTIFIQWTSV